MQARKILNVYRNTQKMVEISSDYYEDAYNNGIMGLYADAGQRRSVISSKESYVDFTRCSYLGLDSHPIIVNGAMNAIKKYKSVQWSCARTRLNYQILKDLEDELSTLFSGRVICFSSVTLANACILPLIASGSMTNGVKPTIVFDQFCHASLSFLKAILADETKVITIAHNDLGELERICQQEKSVAYIADGVYSMGGQAPVKRLLELQNKYNLFLYLDDAHGISIFGKKGEGYVRSQLYNQNSKIITAASLAKGFGSSGGILVLANQQQEKIVRRFGSTYAFSALPNIPAVGASLGAAVIHKSEELNKLQQQLQNRIDQFDGLIVTEHAGNHLPIRIVRVGKEKRSIEVAKALMQAGFYASAVFFPVVPRGQAAIRISLSAMHRPNEIEELCQHLLSMGLPRNEL